MNKLTKYGVSALCGSLAAVSAANAGDMSVSGTVDMSWVTFDDEVTGNPIGMGSNVRFTGTGELDSLETRPGGCSSMGYTRGQFTEAEEGPDATYGSGLFGTA